MRQLTLLVLILVVAGQICAQVANVDVLNVGSSPLRLSRTPSNFLEAQNISQGHVVGIRLGCVYKEGNRVKVRTKFDVKSVNIEPPSNTQTVTLIFGSFHGPPVKCPEGLLLSVIQVVFDDDSAWSLDSSPPRE